MARQIVQINVVQDSSGSPLRVALSWTSDGHVVKTGKHYLRQPGGYTTDAALADHLERAVLQVVAQVLRTEQLF
jgi:hypothetical protein